MAHRRCLGPAADQIRSLRWRKSRYESLEASDSLVREQSYPHKFLKSQNDTQNRHMAAEKRFAIWFVRDALLAGDGAVTAVTLDRYGQGRRRASSSVPNFHFSYQRSGHNGMVEMTRVVWLSLETAVKDHIETVRAPQKQRHMKAENPCDPSVEMCTR
ncbi:hypothetical protein GMOD_00006639 [Pyrenophora seminiperda CCB06]|uniref:Uncharacterized protein n=1 Tax=Pyrenophora seminiperda CCB06 TaxID=1302712 RepID=A0A3M7MAH8_9PLEO|nr:hypothetical protein GMOD_00006639 [Pyrenophora seminiperda CCB06]